MGTQVMTINTTARMATADYGNQKYQLSTCIGCGFTSHSTFQLYINCQLVLAVGSQAIQRFNFISTNFQPSTDNVNWFCCNTDNSTLVLHCISKYMKSSQDGFNFTTMLNHEQRKTPSTTNPNGQCFMPSKCSSNPHELQCVDDNLCINVPKRKYITNSNLKRNLQ